jgi:hypothetical protein
MRIISTLILLVLLVGALVAWVVTHGSGNASDKASANAPGVDYASLSVPSIGDENPTSIAEVSR